MNGAVVCTHKRKHRHGTRNCYQMDGCRCFRCRLANSNYKLTGAQPLAAMDKVNNAGTIRRLRALHRIGWTWTELGKRLDLPLQSMREVAGIDKYHQFDKCYLHTAEAVAALYDELWNVHPAGVAAKRARLDAEKQGFLPPVAWDDESIDNPEATPSLLAVDPQSLPLKVRYEVAGDLVALGYTKRDAAKRMQISYDNLLKRTKKVPA